MGGKLFRTWEFPRSVSKAKNGGNTPGTAGGPGGRDRTLDVKRRKNAQKIYILKKIEIYFLVMPKYWVQNYFAHGRFPEVGQKQKTERKEEKKEKEKERLTDGDNNGQATHGARKPPGPKDQTRYRYRYWYTHYYK